MHIHIIGGGIIGLFTAIHLQSQGHIVTVFNAPEIPAASWYAGGMLAPFSEAWLGEERALAWGNKSLELWKGFLETIDSADRQSIVTAESSLLIAVERADKPHVQRVYDWLQEHSYKVHALQSTELVHYPGLSTKLAGGIIMLSEYALDNRKTLELLERIFIEQGGKLISERWDSSQRTSGIYVFTQGMEMAERFPYLGIRGVQGEIIRLEKPHWGIEIPTQVIRGVLHNRAVYIIPRADGVVIGATEYEAHDRKPQLGGVFDLLSDAITILPGLRDYTIREISACVRPVRPDGLAWVGRLDENTFIATGHGRNGFLLAPLTARVIEEIITDPRIGRRDLLDLSIMEVV